MTLKTLIIKYNLNSNVACRTLTRNCNGTNGLYSIIIHARDSDCLLRSKRHVKKYKQIYFLDNEHEVNCKVLVHARVSKTSQIFFE
jgi:hypothetical protein